MAKTKVFRKKSSKNWTRRRKMSINCKKPKGFSQKQYCKYGRKKNRKSHKKGGIGVNYTVPLPDEKEENYEEKLSKALKAYEDKSRNGPSRGGLPNEDGGIYPKKTPYGVCIAHNRAKADKCKKHYNYFSQHENARL